MANITETDSRFLNELVKDTITFRLTTGESLKYIAMRFGRAISTASYNLRKGRLLSEQSTNIWLDYFSRIGFVQMHKENIENIQKIEEDTMRQLLLEMNRDIRNEWLVLKLKEDARENIKLLSELALGTPIINSIKKKMEELRLNNHGPNYRMLTK
ncbi:MAG: hypothetical protein WBN72_02985 [Nitrososphaeraceae archaeon]